MKLNYINLNLPSNFDFFIIIKNYKLNILIINKNFKFLIILNNKFSLKTNKNNNQISFKKNNLNLNLYTLQNKFYLFLKQLNNYYFTKIKFKGKGYKIFFNKKKKLINFYFGRSHITIMKFKNIILKKIKKYKIIFYCNNKKFLNDSNNKLINIRKINFYTGRGLRKSRQIIIKRKGKQGSFI